MKSRAITAILMALVFWLGMPAQGEARTLSGVAHAIDGDTIVIEGVRIRLEGIDAPESRQHCRDPRRAAHVACGAMATAALRELVSRGPTTCHLLQRDRYGRFIGRCARSGSALLARGQDLSLAMVSQGWAVAFMADARPELRAAEQAARLRRVGVWAYEFQDPAEFRRAAR